MDAVAGWISTMALMATLAYFAIRGTGKRRIGMRTYQVWLTGMTKFVEVKADDVNLEMASENDNHGETAFWNFIVNDNTTVAGFPFKGVEYFVTKE